MTKPRISKTGCRQLIIEALDDAWTHYLVHKDDVLGDEHWLSSMRMNLLKAHLLFGRRWVSRQAQRED